MSDSAMTADSGDARPNDRTKSGATRRRDEEQPDERVGFFASIVQFVRHTIGEMKLVRYPTNEELWQYFVVVICFVAVLMAFTGLVDLIFDKLTLLVFV